MFTGDRRAVRTFVATFGILSRSSLAVAETSFCVHHGPAGGFAFNGRVQLSWTAWHKQVCDFMHVVEVSDTTCDCLRGLHHCFFGWRASRRLQLLEVCEPLSQRRQRLRFVSAGNRLGKLLVKYCRVLLVSRHEEVGHRAASRWQSLLNFEMSQCVY